MTRTFREIRPARPPTLRRGVGAGWWGNIKLSSSAGRPLEISPGPKSGPVDQANLARKRVLTHFPSPMTREHLEPSMGPLFFRAENALTRTTVRAYLYDPSMGPLFFRAENCPCHGLRRPSRPLQWGRSFSERRTATVQQVAEFTREPSMGPLFFRAENHESDQDQQHQ